MKVREQEYRAGCLWSLAAWLLTACLSNHEPQGLGGESHFLRHCDDECGGDLDCIQGVCTRGCVVGKDGCGDLATAASCTAESGEPGAVAVCDLSCSGDGDCRALSDGHRCENGFCRAAVAAVSDAGSLGNVDAGSSGSADAGSSVAMDAGFPYPTDQVFVCPSRVDTDPVDVLRSIVQGDVLLLRLGHGGGCRNHEYAVCYDDYFAESYPVQTELRVIHEDNGDTCEAYLMAELRLDLEPIAQTYERYYRSTAGLVETNFGIYAFGALSCEERELGASRQAQSFSEQASRECQTASDCRWADDSTTCNRRCGTVASNTGAAELADWLEITSTAVCRDYEADGCPLPIPVCEAPPPLACVSGQCQVVQ